MTGAKSQAAEKERGSFYSRFYVKGKSKRKWQILNNAAQISRSTDPVSGFNSDK